MPTTLTHALAGLGMASAFAAFRPVPPSFFVVSVGLALLPDLDVIGFRLGVPYRSRWGHRGLSHSFILALAVGLLTGALTAGVYAASWWLLGLFFTAVVVGHDALDALTNGGLGIAFFAPFDEARYFFPWRPIQVSPIGLAVFSRWGWLALLSEVVWVWLPLAALIAAAVVVRSLVR